MHRICDAATWTTCQSAGTRAAVLHYVQLTSLAAVPAPGPPSSSTWLPMHCSTGRARSNDSFLPPQKMVRSPVAALGGPPEMGQSMKLTPRASHASAHLAAKERRRRVGSAFAGWQCMGQHAKDRQMCSALQWQHRCPVCSVSHSRCCEGHVAKTASPQRCLLRDGGCDDE